MRAFSRLGVSVLLSCSSLVSIILLLPRSRVSTRLQKIALGTSLDNYVPDIWRWASGDEYGVEGGIQLVIFGDSWVDSTIAEGEDKKGQAWVDRLCDEISCTSFLNFASSQPLAAYPSSPPTGTFTSNEVYLSYNDSSLPRTSAYLPPSSDLLPDLAAQIKEFLALPASKPKPKETIYVVSFGIWDIYHYSGLDYSLSQKLTDSTIHEMFAQLDILYHHYRDSILLLESTKPSATPAPKNETDGAEETTPRFRVIIPKLFDPTLLPGWIAQRPVPMAPSSVAEQQKNAAYLTTRWNSILENKMGAWIKNDTVVSQNANVLGKEGEVEDKTKTTEKDNEDKTEGSEQAEEDSVKVQKDAFYYDLSRYLTNIIIEHQLEDAGLSDASGLGNGESPFESVYNPCVVSSEEEVRPGDTELNGFLICEEPSEYLFWDDFRLGPTANEKIGEEIAEMVIKGKSVRKIWEEGKSHS